ncbi:MAG: cell division protein FtsQ/DivIB [Candidatus Omnitrophica bacterium]|nr:cell division protein FtsQ/DivIB [Candidatus Omnitrophota bacterium]MDD5513334.1 cell division protein FtsQ/DivIB [Candidatus Omnitrophota bacterium]
MKKHRAAAAPKKKKLNLAPLFFILVLLGATLLLWAAGSSLKDLDYFKIKDVIVSGNDGRDFSYLKGRNIFLLDLKAESQELSGAYPDFLAIRIVRVLPDRVYIDFVKRSPVAQVKLYRVFCVDAEGVFFECQPAGVPGELPLIKGLQVRIFAPKTGKRYNNRELSLALQVIGLFAKNPVLSKRYRISQIDVENILNTSFVVVPEQGPAVPDPEHRKKIGFEVKIGSEYTADRIAILSSLLKQLGDNAGKIKYVDLRFKETVIKFNNDK